MDVAELTRRQGLTEAFSGFHAIGHNSWSRLVFLWIIPKYVFNRSCLRRYFEEDTDLLQWTLADLSNIHDICLRR